MNLVSLSVIKNKIKSLNLDNKIEKIDYAKDGKHKYYVVLKNKPKRKIKFGDINYQDYLIHKNNERRINYRSRHRNDNINDINKPGFWSYSVLW